MLIMVIITESYILNFRKKFIFLHATQNSLKEDFMNNSLKRGSRAESWSFTQVLTIMIRRKQSPFLMDVSNERDCHLIKNFIWATY